MRLTTFSYYADFFVSLAAVVLMFGVVVLRSAWPQRAEWAAFSALGLSVWTLVEYAVHRWIYHRLPYFDRLHEAHHADPDAFIGAPPLIGVGLIFLLFFAPLVSTSFTIASGLTSGILVGYMTYMLVHHAAHHWSPPKTSYLHRLRRHHALHHHRSGTTNFGVTTSLWDVAFGTNWATSRKQPDTV